MASPYRRAGASARTPRKGDPTHRRSEMRRQRVKVARGAADEPGRGMAALPHRSTSCSSTASALGASDLHLTVGSPPVVRVRGKLVALDGAARSTPTTTQALLYRILSTEQQKRLELDKQIDLAHDGAGRRALPRQRLLPARVARRGAPPDSAGHQVARGARPSADAARPDEEAARPRPRHRARPARASRRRSRR